jgi:hypothetical protein
MGLASLAIALALSAPSHQEPIDMDAPVKAARVELGSPWLRDMMTAAMATPYKYGVTQMPCKAFVWQPARGWSPAREPSGRISWIFGPAVSVKWSGIYGTCYIRSPRPRHEMGEIERTALECECNGWLPKGFADFPKP